VRWLYRIFAIVLAIALLCGALLVWESAGRSRVYEAAARDPAEAAMLIARNWPTDLAKCGDQGLSRDVQALLGALFAIEGFATGRLERLAETATARLASVVGVGPPDLSYGPGQIRLSAAERVLARYDQLTIARPQLAERLLDACFSRYVASLIVADLAEFQLPIGILARVDVIKAIALYNGQRAPDSTPPTRTAVSHAVYREVAYHLFQLFRFEGANQR